MKKSFILLFAIALISFTSFAQSNEEPAVRECLQNYMSGQSELIEKAFHPSATMKYIDYQSKEYKDVPISEYISRVKANTGPRPERKIEITSLNIEGNAAQAKIKIETSKVILYDYMNLLKINGEWKIVSKIFSRQDK